MKTLDTMKLVLTIILCVLPAFGRCQAAETGAEFYVATDGSDAWSGTVSEPNEQRTDGPFASLSRARDAVRSLIGIRAGDVLVLIRGGAYRLEKTVVFGLQDSLPDDGTVTYAAYPGETPIFSSASEIGGWRPVKNPPPELPKHAASHVRVAKVSDRFDSLYDGGGMLPRARSAGFIPERGGSRTTLRFPAGKLKNWSNIEDVEIVVRPHHAWIVNILPLQSVDQHQHIARTSVEATYAMNRLHFLKDTKSCWGRECSGGTRPAR